MKTGESSGKERAGQIGGESVGLSWRKGKKGDRNGKHIGECSNISKQTVRQAERGKAQTCRQTQTRRQTDIRENKGCVPPPRSAAPKSICCLCTLPPICFTLIFAHLTPLHPCSLSLLPCCLPLPQSLLPWHLLTHTYCTLEIDR